MTATTMDMTNKKTFLATTCLKTPFEEKLPASLLKRILPLIFFVLLTSCHRNWYKPMGYLFKDVPKNGNPGFTLGWIHGCESGLGTQFAGAIYQSFYSWKRDPDIASSNPNIEKIRKRYPKELKRIDWSNQAEIKKNFSDYNTIFWGAHYYCRQMAIGLLISADMKPPVADDERYNPMAHSVGNVWKITGRGDTRIGTGLW